MSLKKNIGKILADPTEMRLDEVTNVLVHLGFSLDRVKGSHYTFKCAGYPGYVLPCHKGKVKRYYLRKIRRDFMVHLLAY